MLFHANGNAFSVVGDECRTSLFGSYSFVDCVNAPAAGDTLLSFNNSPKSDDEPFFCSLEIYLLFVS